MRMSVAVSLCARVWLANEKRELNMIDFLRVNALSFSTRLGGSMFSI